MIPNIIVDNFFSNPDKIRDIALSLDYNIDNQNYPGQRAKVPDSIAQQIQEKILSLIIDLQDQAIKWTTNLHFQKISKDYKGGWIHRDDYSLITCIIYLSPESFPCEGTSLYKLKNNRLLHDDTIRLRSFKNKYSSDEDEIARHTWNNQFEEVLKVDNVYNRLFMFYGKQWHGVPKYNSDRLTLLYFVHGLECKSLPIPRKDSYNL